MKNVKVILALLSVLVISGCATIWPQADRNTCIWGTALTGFGVGGAVGNIVGAGAGLGGGALLGFMFCEGAAPAPAPAAEEPSGYFWPDDQDRDGVNDRNDRCPFTPEGVAVDSEGCALDADGDGVPDYLDKCPDTPLGTVVDTDGCPRLLVRLQDVHFAFDSAQLTSEAKSILNSAISSINANPSDTISIEGHTDSTGSDAYNSQLSQRRARSVAEYLASHGVSASRLQTVGMGESHPIASNDTSSGRAQNRRVEIIAK